MSRCFPFPPPGYEKKILITPSAPLKKEKHREKKHRKEKKDKVKKEDKEKNEKDKNDGKSRDKKDRKEKHRDKKKEKGRDRDRQTDNLSTSGETRLEFQLEGHDEQTVIQDSARRTLLDSRGKTVGYSEENHGHYPSPAREPNGIKIETDVERSTAFNAKRVGGQMREKIITMDYKSNQGGGTFNQNSHKGNNFIECNLALELDRRLKNEAEQPYDQKRTANKFVSGNQKKDGRVIQSVSMDTMEGSNNRITTSSGHYFGDKSPVVKTVPYASGPAQCNIARVARPPLVTNTEKKIGGHEKINRLEDGLEPRGKKRKDKERNGETKDNGKDKRKDKERKENKGNNTSDQKCAEQDTGQNQKMAILFAPNKERLHSGVYSKNNTSNGGNLHQKEELLSNGISHVAGPGEFSRPSLSLHLHNENGRMPEPRQIPLKPSPDGRGATNILKVDMVGKVNGIVETLVLRPATEQVVQARPLSPHPDTKQFLEILSVPKIEDLSEIDDSDWLISSNEAPEKKHKVDASLNSTVADAPHVWSKATNIESADVYALPYVIPY